MHKHDTELNWNLSDLVPKQGELIIYDADENYNYERLRIGDGKTTVINLPFIDETFIISSAKVTHGESTLDNFLNDIQIPTKTSQLENDSNFLTEADFIILDGGTSEDII